MAAVDVVRGLLLVAIVLSGSLLEPPAWFDHAVWLGVHPLDLVFPSFVVLMGVGLGFASARGVQLARLPRRVLVLLAAGLAFNAALQWARLGAVDLDQLRWTGVLQQFALLTLVISVVHLVVRGWLAWTAAALGFAAAHTWVVARWAATCPGGELTPTCNPSLALDPLLVPVPHLYWQMGAGHDPEGLVSLLGACATTAAGVAAAHALRGRPGVLSAAGRLVVVALVLTGGAVAASLWVPAMKRLWTAPFGLSVAAGVVLVLAVVHLLVDARWAERPGAGAVVRAVREPLVALGRNSLLVYVGSEVLVAFLLLRPLRADPTQELSYAQSLAQGLAWLGGPQVGFSTALLVAWWVLALALHRRRWYLRA
ncbi:Predicted acyltransferase [Quadrisphaera granulorum]|uniref:Putative acyltransferase n=1 Tax=Quadrisphaera granulorum TaxID=317664 RepID=A0A315ZR85_9ACTN|nr:heparan-alpha-glucosaminide N-acetyltransferase domain-containing protein [Quadrisphaera granulorum]PWJ47194.1 putative acyltransferase [Quadrisphaera granulorum]SZE98880.1 Predicted acyltransferase [Quadrisphaera granulorum]